MILVTGAGGFAGSHLLDLLVTSGADIVAWHRPGTAPPRENDRIAWQEVDLLDRLMVADAIRRRPPDAVYHLAGYAHVGRAWDETVATFEINVRGTHFLLEALREASRQVPLLVPSSAMIYRPATEPLSEDHEVLPSSPYGVSKLAQEMFAVQATFAPIVVVRPFNHAGPRQAPDYVTSSFARQIVEIERGMAPPILRVGNLDSRRDITDVRDVVRAYRLLVLKGRPWRPYNVCSGVAYRVGDLLDTLVGLAGVRLTIEHDPSRMRPSDNPVVLGDRSRILDEIGWAPEIPMERTLRDLLDHWRQQFTSESRS